MSEYITPDKEAVSVGVVDKQYYTFAFPPQPLQLESGAQLGPVTLAYETYGELTPGKDNVILILHALTGDAHAAGYHHESDEKPGWWEFAIGPGKAIDTDKYFVICSNILGSCMGSSGPSAMNPETDRVYGLDFPLVTIGDMVQAQKALIDYLGIKSLLCVIGGSIGGMQVLEWCLRYPDMVVSAIPIATTARHSPLAIAFNEVARQSITADPKWNNGDYYQDKQPELGLAVARMIGHITYLSDASMQLKFGRRLQDKSDFSFDFGADFQVENYLRYQGSKFVERFDANAFLYITKAADYFDIGKQYGNGSVTEAFKRSRAAFLVISYTSDWLYPTTRSKQLVKAMQQTGRDVSFCEIEAEWGHDAFLLPSDRFSGLIRAFLKRVYGERHAL
jgi:homoserine O-acetyltransferase/O-succinyltransferase